MNQVLMLQEFTSPSRQEMIKASHLGESIVLQARALVTCASPEP